MLEGLAVALSNVDEIIALIKAAPTPADAKRDLMERVWRSPLVEEMLSRAMADSYRPDGLLPEFGLSDQGYRLSDVRRRRFSNCACSVLPASSRTRSLANTGKVMDLITDLLDILARPERITAIITEELTAIRDQFGDPRRSEVVMNTAEINIEDLIAPEDMVVTLSHTGYFKRQPLADYRAQRRGGRANRRPR